MRSMNEISCPRFLLISLFSVALGLAGCEEDSEDHIWDDHDFGSNDPNMYVAMGDSITAGYGLNSAAEAYPYQLSLLMGKTVVNRGVSGSRSSYGVSTVDSVLSSYQPGYLLILYGANDLIMGYSVESVLSNLEYIIAVAKNNQTIPVIATLTPVFDSHSFILGEIIELNAGIRQLGIDQNVHIADLESALNWNSAYINSDGLHPNAEGHQLIAVTFYDILD